MFDSRRDEIAGLRAWALGPKNEGGRAMRANSVKKGSKSQKKIVGAPVKIDDSSKIPSRAGTINMTEAEL